MKPDCRALLRLLGPSVPDAAPAVKRKGSVSGPDSPFHARCPLHQDPDGSLEVHPGDPAWFRCSNPACLFRGDAVSLAAVALGVSPAEAVEMFRPGGRLASCLAEPLDKAEADLYAASAETQAGLKAYLAKCRQALRRSPERARIRTGMSQTSARLLHPDAALFLDLGESVPKCLSEFTRPKYRGLSLVLYPFTMCGEVTRIDVVDPANPAFRRTVVVTHPTAGVFGEECVDGLKAVVGVEDPAEAASLYAAHALVSQKPPPVIAFSDYPLPSSLSQLQSIRILSTVDRPVSTALLVKTLSAREIVAGARPSPKVRVMKTEKRHDALSMSDIAMVATGTGVLHDVQRIVARRLADLVRRGCHAQALEAMSSEDLPESMRNLVADTAREMSSDMSMESISGSLSELADLLTTSCPVVSSTMRLANGRTLVREPSALFELTPRGTRNLLCNLGVSVDGRIVSSAGTDLYSMSFTAADGSPPIRVRIDASEASDPSKIRRKVSSEYARMGMNPYVAFYRVPGCDWSDVVAKLSEHCPVRREVASLGMDGLSRVNLPEVVVTPEGKVLGQDAVYTMPERSSRLYSAIPADDTAGLDPYRRLLEGCGNLYTLAYTLGVTHVAYQLVHRLYRTESRQAPQRHLLYVETEPGIWGPVFQRLSETFSGGGLPPVVNYSSPAQTFSEYARLGDAPLIASVPTAGGRFSTDLDSSGVNLVGLLDTSTAVMTNGRLPAVYLTPSDDRPAEVALPNGEWLDAIRRSFPALLSKIMSEARVDAAFRSSPAPCLTMYTEACRLLGAERFPTDDVAKQWFPGVGMNGATMFLDLLHRSLQEGGRPHVTVVNGPPQPGYSFTRRGQHVFVMRDVVVVSHMVADMMTQASKGMCRFDKTQLGDEMRATGLLAKLPKELGIDGSRCWCMTREAWETRAVRPPVSLPEPVMSGTINVPTATASNPVEA